MDKKKLGFVIGVLGTTAALTASYFSNLNPSYADFIDKDMIARLKGEEQIIDADAKDSSDKPASVKKKDREKEREAKSNQEGRVYNRENQVEYILDDSWEEKPKVQKAPANEEGDQELAALEKKAVKDLPDVTDDQAMAEAERKAKEEAKKKAQEEAERKAKEEADRKAREEAERKAQAEADRKAKEEAERKAQEEAERKAQEEANRKAKEEAERKAKEEAEKRAQEEAERKAQEEAEKKAQEEAERKAQEEAEKKAQEEAEKKAQEEAEKKAQEEAEEGQEEAGGEGQEGSQEGQEEAGGEEGQESQEGKDPELTGMRQRVVKEAYKYLGTPYVWGGNGPDSFDCSGFTSYIYRNVAGINLPRTAYDQQFSGTPVSWEGMEPGDLIYFKTLGGRYNHVGIYIGNRQMIHASSDTGVVRVEAFNNYWAGAFVTARKVINE